MWYEAKSDLYKLALPTFWRSPISAVNERSWENAASEYLSFSFKNALGIYEYASHTYFAEKQRTGSCISL